MSIKIKRKTETMEAVQYNGIITDDMKDLIEGTDYIYEKLGDDLYLLEITETKEVAKPLIRLRWMNKEYNYIPQGHYIVKYVLSGNHTMCEVVSPEDFFKRYEVV